MTTPTDLRMERARLSLEGLSLGDAFGERFFEYEDVIHRLLEHREPPPPPWPFTDDTQMALSIVGSLRRHGAIDQDWLAHSFAQHYEPSRGYGAGMHRLLRNLAAGGDWRTASRQQFSGQGSFGNGAAMRVAPLGGYFADDLDQAVEQAARSAEVTHAHPEGVAGAIAVAVAAAWAWRIGQGGAPSGATLLDLVLPYVPDSEVRSRIGRALNLSPGAPPQTGAAVLGSGFEISAQDTVPFAIWCAASYLNDFEAALWHTVGGLGDIDTTCAIVGGIVALSVGPNGLPAGWRDQRESLPAWPFIPEEP
ncbi:MAG: ADP-ribosylglycohydrolase family protein [Roseiflexaceae bacterium]